MRIRRNDAAPRGRRRRRVCGAMAVIALGVMARSLFVTDSFRISRAKKVLCSESSAGFFRIDLASIPHSPQKEGVWHVVTVVPGGMISMWWDQTWWCWRCTNMTGVVDYQGLGFRLRSVILDQPWSAEIQLPYGVVAGGLAWMAMRGLPRRRVVPGARVCDKCGYDTRGNSGRCSECGAGVG
jgi:hypothetical protein